MYLTNNIFLKGGEYKIFRFINAGRFGNTCEGLDVNLNKRVAIKEFLVKDFELYKWDLSQSFYAFGALGIPLW